MVVSHFNAVVCLQCQRALPADILLTQCPHCGSGWIDARYDYDAAAAHWGRADALAGREQSLWRYGELLPLAQPDPDITLREGATPLIRLYQYERLYAHESIYIKDERQGATSSFKDRQAALAVTAMRRAGIRECVLASTGNAAAAYAAYCARAGIKLWLFLTSLVPSEKMREAALYGAEVVKVSGTYDETKQVAAEFAARRGIHFDRGARAIPGKESMKTLAFEIAEQLGLERRRDGQGSGWAAPDWYIQAVSGGIGPLGVWKGFTELYQMGLIDRLPRLAIVQAAGCAPMVRAFEAGLEDAPPVVPRTLITVLATGDPGFSYRLLREAVLAQGGVMLAIEDGEAFAAMRHAASRAGLSVEPATAVAFAGLERMLSEGVIEAGETVVLNCSGHTFPAESHILGDQYALELAAQEEGLSAALARLDEQITTILVVDDDPAQRRLIRRMLGRTKRYRVFEARSGKEALSALEAHNPDLIVTDLMMPEMDGFTLLEQLKWNPATMHIPVVVVSAKPLTSDDRALLERYDASVWTKGSFETTQLVQHIAQAVGDAVTHVTPYIPQKSDVRASSPDYTVLLMFEDVRVMRQVRRRLESGGETTVRVIERSGGRAGLKALYEYRPAVVVIDHALSDLSITTVIETIEADASLSETTILVYANLALESKEEMWLADRGLRLLTHADLDTLTPHSLTP